MNHRAETGGAAGRADALERAAPCSDSLHIWGASGRGAVADCGVALSRRLLALSAGRLTRPIGQLNGAIQEYHYLPHRGVPLGPWGNAICHLDAWWSATRTASPTSSSIW